MSGSTSESPSRDDWMRLGFIGLGVMGSAECANLLAKSGRPVTVYDASVAAAEALVGQGADRADSVADVAASSDIIFLSLPGSPEVEAVTLGSDGITQHAAPGTVVIDLSTVSVGTARRVAAEIGQKQLRLLDAPVARTRQAAIAGTLSMTVGGDRQTYERVRPLLHTMATRCAPLRRERSRGADEAGEQPRRFRDCSRLVGGACARAYQWAGRRPDGIRRTRHGVGRQLRTRKSRATRDFARRSSHRNLLQPIYAEGPAVQPRAGQRDRPLTLPAGALAHELLQRTIDAGYADNYHTAVSRIIADPTNDSAGS